jgi:hypothetical protein
VTTPPGLDSSLFLSCQINRLVDARKQECPDNPDPPPFPDEAEKPALLPASDQPPSVQLPDYALQQDDPAVHNRLFQKLLRA